MPEVLLGSAAIVVGLLLCLVGAHVLRALITVWAALTGFVLGAGLVASATGDSFLAGAVALAVAVVVAALFGLAAYAMYAVAILIAMMAFGFTLGTDLVVALGVSWSWLIVLVGATVGLLLGVAAVAADLPLVVLVVLSAFAGSSMVLTGVLLLGGALDRADLVQPGTPVRLDTTVWWWLAYVALAAVGAAVQMRRVPGPRASARSQWARSQPPRSGAHVPLGHGR